MPIYRGTAPLKAYKGDMQPVNVYEGSTKVAGWHLASYSGTSPLTVDCDYNVAPDALVIDGRCVQTGTPSPSSPAPISTITGNVGITGADGAASDTATVAFGSAVCASLPDGTHDSYDAVTGVLTKRVGKIVFDGRESWFIENSQRFTCSNPSNIALGVSNSSVVTAICNRFIVDTANNTWLGITDWRMSARSGFSSGLSFVMKSCADVTAFKAWLAANPVMVYYKLATPNTVQLTPHLPVVRTGIKTLAVGADVVPTISATVKSMD